MTRKVEKSEAEWASELSQEQYRITRQHGTEMAFTGKYHDFKGEGRYHCSCCGELLFDSAEKYDSGSGWPSFWQAANPGVIGETRDTSHGMVRTEVHCNVCQAHLGHLFPDGPQPTGLRYCVNSASLDFRERNDTSGD